ncbi:hypothetical protein ACHAXA_011652 [Cyclostephanos tholiformis]|uniref:GAG-pre-integrase domain-containing protein n=1 Tax=Cyclostephanos tholiformis TaxID=382380 RepID=A0ABD3SF43_9STRA
MAPFLFSYLLHSLLPEDPKLLKTTLGAFLQSSQWRWSPQSPRRHAVPLRLRGKSKPSVRLRQVKNTKMRASLRTYLLSPTMSLFRVGCRLGSSLTRRRMRESPVMRVAREPLMALSSAIQDILPVRFDSDSYSIGVDCHASRCMANSPHLFEDLKLIKMGAVEGIKQGLEIKGIGTFKFKIEDDDGRTHEVKIKNSLYLPELRRCLLSPQHWAQEAGDNHPLPRGTRMENDDANCILFWGQGKYKKTIPHNPDSNVPILHTAASALTYRAFATTFEAMEANFYRREHVRQLPGLRRHEETPDDQEFIADENVHFNGAKRMENGVSADDETIKMSKVTSPSEGEHEGQTRMRALTFDPSPPLEEEEEVHLAAADDQAELMRWHYRLGHLPFARLKLLAKNGEVPRRLAKVPPPKCAGCLFGAMTKVPWRGRESRTSHEVFVASKPGECVSVDHMVSTQAGFYAQLKGKLTNKRYRAASVFVDHFSRLRFVHLMQDLSSEETVNAKLAFERFARARLNAHFQNGIAERAIRDLSESARKQLLHARHRWPAAVHVALWPYALRNAALLHNNLPTLEDGTSRLELFSSIRGRRDVTLDTGIDDVKYAINSGAFACTKRVPSPLGNHDPRDGICGTDDDNDGARWCTSGVVVGWEDVCCSLCCQLCTLAQMARHTVDYEERDAACCNTSGVADWDDDEAYVGVEYGHVLEGSVLVV